MKISSVLLLLVVTVLVAVFFFFDFHQYFSLETLKQQQATITLFRDEHLVLAIVIYCLVYVAITSLSLPGAAILTLAGGAIFGLLWGTLIVSFASTIGATLAFLAARFVFRDIVKSRFGSYMQAIDAGIDSKGAFYLFTLRLVPIFPFFIINMTMGLTTLKVRTFYWVSQVGMLAGTIVYVNAGTQLASIESLADILSPALIASFALLGFFPIIAKKIITSIQANKIYQPFNKPKTFANNLIVIGAGSAGLVSAYIATTVKAKVTLIEKNKMGGDCLNTGCVPSKALIRSARWLYYLTRAKEFGIKQSSADFDFSEIMARIQTVIRTVEPHDSIARYTQLGVNVLQGEAKIISPWEVQVKTAEGYKNLSTRSIIIAAGAHPLVPSITGLDKIDFLSSDNIWTLQELPKRLLILGGGPIGCELAQSFARLGSQVTQIEQLPRILIREDPDVSEAVSNQFKKEGVDLKLEHTAQEFVIENGEKILIAKYKEQSVKIPFDQVLLAVGRVANVEGYGVEEMGITLSPRQTIATNTLQATNYPNIYACGDVAGPYQFTHTAAYQAWYATINSLFGQFKQFRIDYSVVPRATFTHPEVASVGLNEQEAKKLSIPYQVVSYGIDDLDRAIADGEAYGFVKVLTQPGKDKILGVTIVAEQAGDLIAEFVLAMKHGLGLNKILNTIHIYPTMAEANKYVAGAWKRQHAPTRILNWVQRYLAWRRG